MSMPATWWRSWGRAVRGFKVYIDNAVTCTVVIGAGKTTLLNAISKRGPMSSGKIWFSEGGSMLAWSRSLKRLVAYVEQDDMCSEKLTVRETLLFTARLRLPKASLAEKSELVDNMINLLGLRRAAHTKLGSVLNRGVSGGERKRTMIGQEMLTNPKLLACDEPLSGLDATTALVVVNALDNLSKAQNVAVVASVHQPTSRIFLAFRQLILLDREGVVYRGPTVSAGDAFAAEPFDLPCPNAFSAADWLMDIVVNGEFSTIDIDDHVNREDNATKDDIESVDQAKVNTADTSTRQARRAAVEKLYGVISLPPPPEKLLRRQSVRASQDYSVPYSEQVRVLFLRTWKEVRSAVFEKNAVTLHLGNATLAGLMWWQMGYRERDVWPRLTLAFAIPIAWVFYPLISSLSVVPSSEVVLKKELAANSYAVEAWFLVTTTTLLAPMFAQSLLHVSLAIALSNLGSILVWLGMYCTVILALLTFQSIGLFFSAAVPAENLTTVAMLYVTFAFLFTGLFVPIESTPFPFLAFINPMYYVMGLSVHVVFALNNRRYKCGNDVDGDGTTYPKSCDEEGDGKIAAVEVFREYNFRALTPPVCVVALLTFMVVTRLSACAILKRRMKAHLRAQSEYDKDSVTS